jgi:hypothetical protein
MNGPRHGGNQTLVKKVAQLVQGLQPGFEISISRLHIGICKNLRLAAYGLDALRPSGLDAPADWTNPAHRGRSCRPAP